ncbi:MAG: hypothetical protein H7Y11_10845 [Armatimonadetes bacterium]|nr:hypothetical protein [Anaerolineae bacterium]
MGKRALLQRWGVCALLIVLLSAAACGSARTTASRVEDTRTPGTRFTPTSSVSAPASVTTPSTPRAAVRANCPGALPTRLILQERGIVTDEDPSRLRVRADPGTQHSITALLELDAVFLVLRGPVCAGDYAWFYVRWRTVEGWVAEGDAKQYYVAPYLPG